MSNKIDLNTHIQSFKTSKEEDFDKDTEELDLQVREELLQQDRFLRNTQSRSSLTKWAATVVTIYLLIVLIILVFNSRFIGLSDTVLSVLLGTTTMNVLGLMYIVLRGYFNYINTSSKA